MYIYLFTESWHFISENPAFHKNNHYGPDKCVIIEEFPMSGSYSKGMYHHFIYAFLAEYDLSSQNVLY